MDLKTNSPRRGLLFPLALALAVSTVSVAQSAQPPAPTDAAAPNPELQQQLKAAQARLEAAAKEVAELSAKAGPGGPRIQIRMRRAGGPDAQDIEMTTMGPPGAGPGPGPGGPPPMAGMEGHGAMMGGMGGMGGMGPMDGRGPMHRMAGMHPGLRLAPLSPRLAGYFGAKSGVLVIKADNPELKLQDGDVITAIGGRTPTSPMHAMRIFRSYEPGEKVPLQLLRDRKPLTVEVSVPHRVEVRRFELRRGEAPPAPPPGAPPAPAHQH